MAEDKELLEENVQEDTSQSRARKSSGKTLSIRATAEDMERLKNAKDACGLSTTGEAFAMLLDIFERDAARNKMPERKTEIDEFNALLTKIGSVYMQSLELCNGAEGRIRLEFQNQLSGYESALNALNEKAEALVKRNKELEEESAAAKKEAHELSSAREKEREDSKSTIEGLKSQLSDKDKMIESLQDNHRMDTEKIADMVKRLDSVEELEKTVIQLKDELSRAHGEVREAERKILSIETEANQRVAAQLSGFLARLDKQDEKHEAERETLKARIRELESPAKEKKKEEKPTATTKKPAPVPSSDDAEKFDFNF